MGLPCLTNSDAAATGAATGADFRSADITHEPVSALTRSSGGNARYVVTASASSVQSMLPLPSTSNTLNGCPSNQLANSSNGVARRYVHNSLTWTAVSELLVGD